jgi:hypothetical protein
MRQALLIVLSAVCIGCSLDDLLGGSVVNSLPAEVRLSPGQYVNLSHEGYVVTFEKVTADSRCPVGVECFWAGDGAAWLKIQDQAGTVRNDTLHTTRDPRSVQLPSLTIVLKKLEPYPVYNVPLDSSRYVVTLEIDRDTTRSQNVK